MLCSGVVFILYNKCETKNKIRSETGAVKDKMESTVSFIVSKHADHS